MKGSCICGDVEYEAGGIWIGHWACSCKNCIKWSGSAFTAGASVLSHRFRWTKGEASLAAGFESIPGTGPRRFCTRCGTPMPSRFMEGMVHIPLGTLDEEPDVKITAVLQALPGWAGEVQGLVIHENGLPVDAITKDWLALQTRYIHALDSGDVDTAKDVEAFAAIARAQPGFDEWWGTVEVKFHPRICALFS